MPSEYAQDATHTVIHRERVTPHGKVTSTRITTANAKLRQKATLENAPFQARPARHARQHKFTVSRAVGGLLVTATATHTSERRYIESTSFDPRARPSRAATTDSEMPVTEKATMHSSDPAPAEGESRAAASERHGCRRSNNRSRPPPCRAAADERR